MRELFSLEFGWREELLGRWAYYWSYRCGQQPDEQIASVVSYLDMLHASKPDSQITWREVLDLQAVLGLSGQPELKTKLALPELRQLSQRIAIRRYIQPLIEKETYTYIWHRLDVAGYKGPALFDPRAQNLIWRTTRGIPRKINIICDNVLLRGYRERRSKIDAALVKKEIDELKWPTEMEKDKG